MQDSTLHSTGQTLDDGIIALIHAHQGELLCIQSGKERTVCGIFARRAHAIAAAETLKKQEIEAMIFSREGAERIKAAKLGRAIGGPTEN